MSNGATTHQVGGSSAAATITEEFTVFLDEDQGSVQNGDTIAAGTTLTALAKALLQKAIAPTYTAPTITITENVTNSQIVGVSIAPTLTVTFTQNDAGAVSNIRIQRRTNGGAWSTISTNTSYTDTITVPLPSSGNTSTIQYRALVDYAQGPVLNNNQGTPDATGQIAAATDFTSSTATITGYFPILYGSDATLLDGTTAYAALTKLTQSTGVKSIAFAATDERLYIAVPNNLSLSAVLDGSGFAVLGDFTEAAITLASTGLDTDFSTGYKLYYTAATTISQTYTATIS